MCDDKPHATDREGGSMSLIENDIKQYQMANQHSAEVEWYHEKQAAQRCPHFSFKVLALIGHGI